MESVGKLEVISCYDLPKNPDTGKVYRLLPKNVDEAYYWERVDRNIGWITREEQKMLRDKAIGVAGCGGMGAQLAEKLLRLGVGEIRVADIERFDASNINRQFAATRSTIGEFKAFATAKMLRGISDDSIVVVYPQGIAPETADHFLDGCDAICDEIEFWAVGARILLHERARGKGISVFNCNTVGCGTRLFFFTPTSATMEDLLGLSLEEAYELQYKIQRKRATAEEVKKLMDRVMTGLVPELPEYIHADCESEKNVIAVTRRLMKEGRASILASNPPMATGFLADHILFYLLRDSSVRRDFVRPPEMPGYLHFDAVKMLAEVVRKRWW